MTAQKLLLDSAEGDLYMGILIYFTSVNTSTANKPEQNYWWYTISKLIFIFFSSASLFLCFQHYRRSGHTKALAFTVSVMTFWKTVLYIAMFFELAGGKDYRKGNTLFQEIFIVYLTNGAWLLFPYLCMASLWKYFVTSDRVKTG